MIAFVRPVGRDDIPILVLVKVGKRRAHRICFHSQAPIARHVLESSISVVSEQDVWPKQPVVDNVQVEPTVSVNVDPGGLKRLLDPIARA